MDAIVEGTSDEAASDLIGWTPSTHTNHDAGNNSTLLYIAVEYVKGDLKMESTPTMITPADTFSDFDTHVSPLDPNMSSVARYSPVYNETSSEYNPVVIHQLVQPDNTQFNPTVDPPPILSNNSNQFLPEPAQSQDNEQHVELLISDQTTGVWYSVRSSQEFLVERCLEDEQLLNALTPDPLLDSDLLALDENALKSELNDEIINANVEAAVNNYISNLIPPNDLKHLQESNKMDTRKINLKSEINDYEDQILSKVYSIEDKPILSRARATLPENYLVINKINEESGVFAKKLIPQRTQFGPLMGILKKIEADNNNDNEKLKFLIENDGEISQLDVSDENTSNWMSFVRKAQNFIEQNLVVSQVDNVLYFTTTKTIVAKQELKVGYSLTYAKKYKLPILKGEDNTWPCYECSDSYPSWDELQKHLNVHDNENEEKPKKKLCKIKKKPSVKVSSETLKCNKCNEVFVQSGKQALKHHLIEKHTLTKADAIQEHFSVILNYKCETCNLIFNSEPVFKIHNLLHENDDSSEELTNHICPSCSRKFPTQRQLVSHVSNHAVLTNKVLQTENFKCTVCHKVFAMRERLRRHMLVHGSDESKPLQCKQCNKRFLNNSALAGHLKTHFVGKKIFECPICKESFDHVLKLKLHVPNHCENNVFCCPHCKKVFKKYSIIRKHIRAFHCEQKHACPHCPKMFPTLDKLRMHLLRHSDHREFLCADCGKQFKRKDKLKEHCKRLHSEERENDCPRPQKSTTITPKKLNPKVEPTDFHRFIYKCHTCLVGFKRRGMLVNHLAKRHPDISPDSVPELNLPILQTTRDYYCQHCDKVYKSSSKRKAHILKNHPGAALPMSNRKQGNFESNLPNPTFSQTVGSITTRPQSCKWCHKQYASKAKLLQHQRKKHNDELNKQECVIYNKIDQIDTIDEMMIEDSCLQNYKVTDILNNGIDDLEQNDDNQFHFVTINGNENFSSQTNNEINNSDLESLTLPNSHLYRLLTTSNDLVPPR